MNEDLLISKIIKLEEDVAGIKEKVKKLDEWDTMMHGQVLMTKILQDIRQEQAFGSQRVTRLEEDVKMIKLRLGMATG